VVFYFLVRIAAAIPFKYLLCTLFGLVIAFAGVSILGFFVSGRVPASDRARQRYWKRFQSPTIAGLVLGVGTIVADFVINSVSILVSWLWSITDVADRMLDLLMDRADVLMGCTENSS
jgi:hypothetical protein